MPDKILESILEFPPPVRSAFLSSVCSRQCLSIFFLRKLKFVKNTPLNVVFSTLLPVFENVVKYGVSYLIYCIEQATKKNKLSFSIHVAFVCSKLNGPAGLAIITGD